MARTPSLLAASFGFYVGWWLTGGHRFPVLWYYPVERTLEFTRVPNAVGIDLFGRLLDAAALGAVVGLAYALAALAVVRRARRLAAVRVD
jgi:hypothetical protein